MALGDFPHSIDSDCVGLVRQCLYNCTSLGPAGWCFVLVGILDGHYGAHRKRGQVLGRGAIVFIHPAEASGQGCLPLLCFQPPLGPRLMPRERGRQVVTEGLAKDDLGRGEACARIRVVAVD